MLVIFSDLKLFLDKLVRNILVLKLENEFGFSFWMLVLVRIRICKFGMLENVVLEMEDIGFWLRLRVLRCYI